MRHFPKGRIDMHIHSHIRIHIDMYHANQSEIAFGPSVAQASFVARVFE